jgi:hypothetical protein
MRLFCTVLEIHLVLAFLVALCALVFSWTPNGRRVVNAVVALQFLVGLVVAAVMGVSHLPIPPVVWLHLLVGLAILGCYGMAMRAGRRAGGATLALTLSLGGIVLIVINIIIGWRMAMPGVGI